MHYEWDAAKALTNRTKHGVDFADAVAVFDDPLAITVRDDHEGEQRFVTLGLDTLGRLSVVVFTWRGQDTIRIISARRATRPEARRYQEEE